MQNLLDLGIATRRGVMTAHRETAYAYLRESVELPISEDAADNSIIIPLYVPMKQEEVDYVIAEFKKQFVGK
jgi:dTDP-4-amino-4,6-dideoxygalactose transaminase